VGVIRASGRASQPGSLTEGYLSGNNARACISREHAYLVGAYLLWESLIDVHVMGVHVMGVPLMGVPLMACFS
jgi:hypothetical protein